MYFLTLLDYIWTGQISSKISKFWLLSIRGEKKNFSRSVDLPPEETQGKFKWNQVAPLIFIKINLASPLFIWKSRVSFRVLYTCQSNKRRFQIKYQDILDFQYFDKRTQHFLKSFHH